MSPGETQGRRRRPTPRTTRSRALAGKTVRYTVTLKGVKKKVVPAADDEFAKDLGDFDEPRRRCATTSASASAPAEERSVDREIKGALSRRSSRGRLRGARGARRAPHDRAHRERGPRPRLPGDRPAQGRGGLDASYREKQREDSVKAAKADILLDEIARREGIEVARRRGRRRDGAPRRARCASPKEAVRRADGEGRRSRGAPRAHPRGEDP